MRQEKNQGPLNNFKFLLDQADCEYFVWFACDDILCPEFLETATRNLDTHSDIAMSFSTIVNIDTYGAVIREYPTLSSLSGGPNWKTITRYILAPEALGKANLFYSPARLEVFREAWEVSAPADDIWGSDMVLVAATVGRAGVLVDRKVLFKKRFCRDDDVIGAPNPIYISNPRSCCPELKPFLGYSRAMVGALRGTGLFTYGVPAVTDG
jgi:hypothetical protein